MVFDQYSFIWTQLEPIRLGAYCNLRKHFVQKNKKNPQAPCLSPEIPNWNLYL